ncbi:MAG: hypothetical protein KDI33_19440, partial [Halioglobus sp.]|nr:hypothetical protein [Halioglobus sp.]
MYQLGLGLLLLSVVGAGFYLYQHLPELLRLRAQHFAQQYGVNEIDFEGLHVSRDRAGIDTLVLRGTYENFGYEARLTAGEVIYDWRVLIGGKVDNLTVSSLDIAIVQTRESEKQGQGAFALDAVLPHRLIAQLPLATASITRWKLTYQPLERQGISASGSLQIDQQLDAQMVTTLAGHPLQADLRSDLDSGNMLLNLSLREDHNDIATVSAQLAQATDDSWAWDLQGTAQHTPLLAWLRELESGGNFTLGIPAAPALSITGETAFTARVLHPNA